MALVDTSGFYKGLKIELEGGVWEVLEYQHSKIAQRRPIFKTKLKNIVTRAVMERNFQSGETFNLPDIERKKMQLLYKDTVGYHFMDTQSFEQFSFTKKDLGESIDFLKEEQGIDIFFYKSKPLGVELPITVELKVTETEPGVKGDTVSSTTKPATLETGVVISVPLFIDIGDIVKVDTRDGKYIERVKKR